MKEPMPVIGSKIKEKEGMLGDPTLFVHFPRTPIFMVFTTFPTKTDSNQRVSAHYAIPDGFCTRYGGWGRGTRLACLVFFWFKPLAAGTTLYR